MYTYTVGDEVWEWVGGIASRLDNSKDERVGLVVRDGWVLWYRYWARGRASVRSSKARNEGRGWGLPDICIYIYTYIHECTYKYIHHLTKCGCTTSCMCCGQRGSQMPRPVTTHAKFEMFGQPCRVGRTRKGIFTQLQMQNTQSLDVSCPSLCVLCCARGALYHLCAFW